VADRRLGGANWRWRKTLELQSPIEKREVFEVEEKDASVTLIVSEILTLPQAAPSNDAGIRIFNRSGMYVQYVFWRSILTNNNIDRPITPLRDNQSLVHRFIVRQQHEFCH